MVQTAYNCGVSAVAVHQGRALLPCRDAEARPMVHTVGQSIGIPQLLHTVVRGD